MKKIKFLNMTKAKQKLALFHINSHNLVSFPTYLEAKKAVQLLGIRSRDEYLKRFF